MAVLGLLAAVGGGFLSAASGQPLDFRHAFAARAGGASADVGCGVGRGVGVWYDGTVMSAAELGQGGTPQAWIAFNRPGGGVGVAITADIGGSIRPADLAAANLDADSTIFFNGQPVAYVGGTFSGGVTFPNGGPFIQATGATNAWLAKEYADFPSSTVRTAWAVAITATGTSNKAEVLSVSAGPPCSTGSPGDLPEDRIGRPVCPLQATFVAAGGYFVGTATFPGGQQPMGAGGEDGFVSLHGLDSGVVAAPVLVLGTTGNERVTAVAVDPKDEHIVVAGTFVNTAIDFDPNRPGTFGPPNFAGGKDIFVAKYEPTQAGLMLVWLYTTGTPSDDEPADVAIDSRGHVYATGWKTGYCGYPDVWAVRLPEVPEDPPYYAVPEWEFTWAGSGEEKGLGVAVDHLDRALITGFFARATCQTFGPNAPLAPVYCLDLNPNPGPTQIDNRCSAGGRDIFVLRMRPDAAYDGAYTFGGSADDEGGPSPWTPSTRHGWRTWGPSAAPWISTLGPGRRTSPATAGPTPS